MSKRRFIMSLTIPCDRTLHAVQFWRGNGTPQLYGRQGGDRSVLNVSERFAQAEESGQSGRLKLF
jgi:hypothetical protein